MLAVLVSDHHLPFYEMSLFSQQNLSKASLNYIKHLYVFMFVIFPLPGQIIICRLPAPPADTMLPAALAVKTQQGSKIPFHHTAFCVVLFRGCLSHQPSIAFPALFLCPAFICILHIKLSVGKRPFFYI